MLRITVVGGIIIFGDDMIILIMGASHTGKTALAEKLMQKYKYPYLSIDHLKMGLIRSKKTDLTPLSEDSKLTAYLWPIVREIIKTAIENNQNLIVEGCYIPGNWKDDFSDEYLEKIDCRCIVFTENYIRNHFEDIKKFASVVEKRLCDDCEIDSLIRDNAYFLDLSEKYNIPAIQIEEKYEIEI